MPLAARAKVAMTRRFHSLSALCHSCYVRPGPALSTFPAKAARGPWATRCHSSHSQSTGLLSKLIGTPHQHTEHLEPLFSKNKDGQGDRGQAITWIGFASNVALAGIKFVAGMQFHSDALIADAGHSVSDVLSDLVTLSTIYLSTLSVSPRFPNGRAALDSLGGLTVSAFLFSGSLAMGLHSFQGIMRPEHVEADLLAPAALVVAFGTILSKELLFRYTMREARRTGQTVLAASAWHHRSDSLCTGVALVGISASLYTQAYWIDPLAGLLVSGIILRASIANSIRPIQGLLPYSPKPSDRLEAFLSSELPSLCPSRIKLSNAYLSVQGGRLELRLRGRAESAAEIALTEFRDSVQLAVDGLAHELPEGQLGVAVELELPEPSEDVQNRRQRVLLEHHHHHHH